MNHVPELIDYNFESAPPIIKSGSQSWRIIKRIKYKKFKDGRVVKCEENKTIIEKDGRSNSTTTLYSDSDSICSTSTNNSKKLVIKGLKHIND